MCGLRELKRCVEDEVGDLCKFVAMNLVDLVRCGGGRIAFALPVDKGVTAGGNGDDAAHKNNEVL